MADKTFFKAVIDHNQQQGCLAFNASEFNRPAATSEGTLLRSIAPS